VRALGRLILIAWLLPAWGSGALSTPQVSIRVTDDRGAILRLARPARRLVALSPHGAELVFAAGAGSRLVGVTAFSDYPPAAVHIPRIGDATRLNRERLLVLHPDLAVAWPSGNRPQDLAWLEQRGIPLYRSDPTTLDGIAKDLLDLGQLTGSSEAAPAADRFSQRLARLRHRYAALPRHPVLYQVWPSPLITLGASHLVSRVLGLCGGTPLFPQLTELAPSVSREAVLLADPYAIVADPSPPGTDPFAQWRRWPNLDAVAHGRLIEIPAALLQRPTPRILEGAERLCKALSGDRRD
jgi:iron complex transport system substrate-binding protein